MCGILGYYSKVQISGYDINKFNEALKKLNHRGPDDNGTQIFTVGDGGMILGQTRLSIIDLTSAGHQPMVCDDERYFLVFNGEIYNYLELREELIDLGYSFKTNTDTEVLLKFWIKWGINGLRRLNGMFAFAVYDKLLGNLTLVRDAFGIKPLFYSFIDGSFSFSSEVASIFKLINSELKIDLQSTVNYLSSGIYDNSSNTFIKDIKHLQSGHFLSIDLKEINYLDQISNPIRWWWPSIKENCTLSFEEAALELRNLFLNSVRLQLRSDVPIGAALSGGIDSSAIVCAMRFIEPDMPIHTFSFVARGSDLNEEYWIDVINKEVNAIPHKVIIDDCNKLSDDIEDMIQTQGEPFSSTSIYAQFRVYKSVHQQGIVVTFDGQGADELLAGYDGYPNWYLKSLIEEKKYFHSLKFLYSWSKWPGRSIFQAIRMFLSLTLPPKLLLILKKLFGSEKNKIKWFNKKWLLSNYINLPISDPVLNDSEAYGRRLMEKLRYELTNNGLLPLLRHGDRNSMRWSIESRVPFLTIDIAEFILSLPESYLLSEEGETKHIFRAAMRGIVPEIVLDRKDKIGFKTPELHWLLGLRSEIETIIKNNDLPFLNQKRCFDEVEKVFNGKEKYNSDVWRLINYIIWINKII